MALASTDRFTDRVDAYVRYRPSYPDAILDAIVARAKLAPGSVIADVGSGTGISSQLWLKRGYTVNAIEPNAAMRAAAEAQLGALPGFHSINATAEATTLPDASVELVFAAQAVHWFKRESAKAELARISKAPGWAAVVWNERLIDTPMLAAYERALRDHATDYANVDHRNVDAETIKAFFASAPERFSAQNEQRFDRTGFFGRALSSSYVPPPGHPQHDAMMSALAQIWAAHAVNGSVVFRYETIAWLGQLKPAR